MSVKAMSWAFEQTLKGNAKSVLLSLANFSDDKGFCWPSHATLAQHAGCSTATVKRALLHLERQGYIAHEHRSRPGRGQTSNCYTLALSVLVFKVAPETQHLEPVAQFELPGNKKPVAQFVEAGSSICIEPVAQIELPTTLNHHLEPSLNQRGARTTAAPLWNTGRHVVETTERVRKVGEKILVSDDFRAEWVPRLGDAENFELSLIEAAGSIQPNNVHSLEAQLARQLSQIARRKREQDQRYAAAAAAKSKARPVVVTPDPPPASRSVAEWRDLIGKHAGKVWGDELGPPVGDPKCQVPAILIGELRLAEKYDERGIMRKTYSGAKQ
jgi:hypothetical protein